MRLGWYISGIGHVVLILGLLFGGLFFGDRIPEPLDVADVSVITEEEFAALVLPGDAPETQTEAPDVTSPDTPEEAPDTPEADAAPSRPEPTPVEEPETPDTADIEVPDPVVPDAVIVDTAPPVPAPPSEQDGTTLEPDAVAAPAPRVAPIPQVAPPPDAETAPDIVPDTAPEPLADPEEQPEPDAPSAPEEASDRIVTEAEEEQNYAPASSRRPRARPARPVRTAEPQEPQEQQEDRAPSTDDAVAAALSEAEEPAPDAPARRGPPLTGGEKETLRVAVSNCWNVGSLSTDALGTTVVVAVEMEQSGKPVTSSIRLVSSSGGSDAAARQAFEAARRAIIRCGARGFPLPVEKYAEWQDIEMTFNPEGMQFR